MNKKISLIILLSLFVFLILPSISHAAIPKLLPACADTGDCNLNEITEVFGNVARIILGVTGSFALLMFILGGFMLLTAAGVQARVEKGKQIITGAVIGIIIIFGAYVGVQFFMSSIGVGGVAKVGTSCGDNKVWTSGEKELECKVECEVEHTGWTCQTKTEITGSTQTERATQAEAIGCETSLCSGATNIVCCPR
ncbi:MAG: hypothetical protein HQ536_00925 [Parcubacteria group bacterium]|nr:hypothetical protein [Parcubacteria group bacterium]